MPGYAYRSEAMQECARRGRRAMMQHPDWRHRTRINGGRVPWELYATDLIADILHGLNSRVDAGAISDFRGHDSTERISGAEAIVARALGTYHADFSEERDADPF